ncbi:MAG: triose-phosphate isomerase [Eubacteriales bacterium]
MRKKLIAGNWKMFKTVEEAKSFALEFKDLKLDKDIEIVICPTFISIQKLVEEFKGTNIKIGAQNMHYENSGAFTGEISADMLSELGVEYCIIGHSERRQYFNETDETVNLKLIKSLEKNIIPIVCVGENLEQRESGQAEVIVEAQIVKGLIEIAEKKLEGIIIAYEPIWAIGTGVTATNEQANEMIGFIRKTISKYYSQDACEVVKILYGGSVKPENAKELMNMSEIDGALVGGASLKPLEFSKIINFRG